MCETPILIHFDPSKECYVETDSSDYVSAGVLFQEDDNGVLHPVAFFSKQMVPAECNYEIYDKELLAIIRCFKEWRPELERTAMPVKVLTNHKGLEYFMTMKKLTPRQARWAEFLSKFNFVVTYQSGKKNDKADALTRKPNKQPISDEDDRQEHRMRVLLPPEQIEIQSIKVEHKEEALARSQAVEPHAEPQLKPKNKPKAPHEELPNEIQPAKRSVEARKLKEKLIGYVEAERHKEAKPEEEAEKFGRSHATGPHAEPHAEPEKETDENVPTLPERVKQSNQGDVLFQDICKYLADLEGHDRPAVYLCGSRAENGLLYKDNKLWVTDNLRLDVIREVYDQPAVGHAGV